MKSRITLLTLACAAVFLAGTAAFGDDCWRTRTSASGNWTGTSMWEVDDNCDASGYTQVTGHPNAAIHRVEIRSDATVAADASKTISNIDIASGATFSVDPAVTLTLQGATVQASTLNDDLVLTGTTSGSPAILQISEDHTIAGSAAVIGTSGIVDPEIQIVSEKELTLSGSIQGNLEINGAGNFTNQGVVHANANATLLVNVSGDLGDNAGDRWKATAAGALLEFGNSLDDNTTSISLAGDFTVSNATAEIQIDPMANLTSPFTTTGKLTISAGEFDAQENVTMGQDSPADPENHLEQTGGQIAVAAGMTFTHE